MSFRPAAARIATIFIALLLACNAAAGADRHPRYTAMIAAAGAVQQASRILHAEKEARGLLPPSGADPNRTGMIGPEYTSMTTSIGELPAKRTATNPDFAAAFVGLLSSLDLQPGTPAVVVLSGSYVGGDVAMIAALEALSVRPIIVVSSSTSQWGATDVEFNILDMLKLLRERGVIRTRAAVAVLGGLNGAGSGMGADSIGAVRASALADGVPLIDAEPFAALIDELVARVRHDLASEIASVVINVGGATVAAGTCDESFEYPSGLTRKPVPCTAGTPGLLMRLSSGGAPVLHVINMSLLADEFGLPYDPVPLPTPGENAAVYGPG